MRVAGSFYVVEPGKKKPKVLGIGNRAVIDEYAGILTVFDQIIKGMQFSEIVRAKTGVYPLKIPFSLLVEIRVATGQAIGLLKLPGVKFLKPEGYFKAKALLVGFQDTLQFLLMDFGWDIHCYIKGKLYGNYPQM